MNKLDRKMLAGVLAVVMLFSNMDYANAAHVNEKSDVTICSDTLLNGATSDGDDKGSVDGDDSTVTDGDASVGEGEVLYSGEMYCGITWEITGDGTLYISGEDELFEEEDRETPWLAHKDFIKKVVADAKEVRITSGWFKDCGNLTEVDFTKFETNFISDMSDMFRNCGNLEKIQFIQSGAYYAENTSGMFAGCTKLKTLGEVSNYFDGIICADEMFAGCSSLETLDLSSFDGAKLESVTKMLDGCTGLVKIRTVKNLQAVIELPMTMYAATEDGNGDAYEILPPNMTYTFELCSALYSGEKGGIKWIITKEDTLFIGGEDTSTEVVIATSHPWHTYKASFSKVILNAKNVKSTAYWFDGCDNIEEVEMNYFEMDMQGDMRCMFRGCRNFREFSGLNYNVFAGTNFSSLFEGCSSLQSVDGGVSAFELKNVTDLSNMFKGCSSLQELEFKWWDTANVVNMDNMFADCSSLLQLDFSEWDVSKLQSAENVLGGCNQIIRIKAFKNLEMAIVLPLTMCDADGNEYTEFPKKLEEGIWLQAKGSVGGEADGLRWNITDNGTLLISGSQSAEITEQIKIYPWHEHKDKFSNVIVMTEDVYSTAYWFDGCDNIRKIVFEQFKADSVTDMSCMFRGCSNLTDVVDVDFWAGNTTSFSSMFEGCKSLEKFEFSRFVTENGKDFSNMFKGCGELCELDVSRLNFEDAVNLSGMFQGCSSLTTMNTDFLYCGDLVDVSGMFSGCKNLETISGLELIKTSRIVDMSFMFYGCEKLDSLDLGNWDIPAAKNMEKMVSGCSGIQEIRMPLNLKDDVELPRELYNIAGELCTDYFTKGLMTSEWMYAENPVVEGEFRITDILPQTYTGKPIKPELKIYDGSKELVRNVDYTLSYKNNTNASFNNKKEPAVVVKGKGNYSEQRTINFEIETKNLHDEDVLVNEIVLPFKKKKVQLVNPILTYNGKKLVRNRDYTVDYIDLDDYRNGDVPAYWLPGVYTICVQGKGNFSGWKMIDVTITDGTLMKNAKISAIPNQIYTGSAIEPELKVTCKGKTLVKGVDYIASYENNIEQGKAIVTVTGQGEYAGTKTATFKIVGESIAKAQISGIEDKLYTGQIQTQNVKVELGGKTLAYETDYTVEYGKNINAGTAEIKIIGVGKYSGVIRKKFKIAAYDLEKDSQKLIQGIPENLVVSYMKGGSAPALKLSFAGKNMVASKDYTISYVNNKAVTSSKNSKTAIIKVKGKGNFKGMISIPFVIELKNLQDKSAPVVISASDIPYVAKAGNYIVKPVLTDVNGKKLVAGTDYENIVYSLEDGTVLDRKNVVNVGDVVKVTVSGKGAYTGELQTSYRITPFSIKDATITIEPQEYTGEPITLRERYIQVEVDGKQLEKGKDYEIIENSYKNNVKCGTASVTIRGLGDYGDNKTVKFKIKGREVPDWFCWITW
ncbi:MAG: BspA family leucine-rich repeat surface protein [Lachnospiraceae bacterium]|nr:BspA family leucine-rich repeat surface protein [Lachnospiraceae bacterium]